MALSLKSKDGKVYQIEPKAYARSKFLQAQADSGMTEVKLDDITGDILEMVVEYLNEYSTRELSKLPEVLQSNDLQMELVDPFDLKFIENVSYDDAFLLINAGVILELDHLHNLACIRIAAFMKGKTIDQVNEEFTIECQLTQEEAKELGLEGGESSA